MTMSLFRAISSEKWWHLPIIGVVRRQNDRSATESPSSIHSRSHCAALASQALTTLKIQVVEDLGIPQMMMPGGRDKVTEEEVMASIN